MPSRRLGVGVLQLLEPQADHGGERHGENRARHAPHGAPKGECHDDDERVQVEAVLHELVLQDAAQHVVDDEGDEEHEDGLRRAVARDVRPMGIKKEACEVDFDGGNSP